MTKLQGLVALLILAACSSSPSGGGMGGTGGEEETGGSTGTGGKGTGGSKATGGSSGGGAGGGSATGGSGGGAGGMATGGSGAGTGGSMGGAGGSPNMAMGYKFGAKPQQYPMGSIRPTAAEGELDMAVKAAYDKWKAAYVTMACGGYVVKTPTNTTSSGALGNGMIITAMMAGHDPDAQKIFDGMYAVARKFPSILSVRVPAKHGISPRPGNQYLLAFAIGNNCTRLSEDDSSPDGDIAFAFALTLADKQWGSTGAINYLEQAKLTAKAIKDYDMNPRKLPGLGDWASLPGEGMWTTVATPTNYSIGHFRAFGKASGDAYWMEAVTAVQGSIDRIQTMFSPMTGLFPQVLVGSMNLSGGTFLSQANANQHAGSSSRVPLWLAADYIASGDAKTKMHLTKINDWLKAKTGGDATKIVDGYRLNGDNIGSTGTMSYVAPFAAISIFDSANQAWLDSMWKLMAAAPTANQGADTSNLLGMLMVTGNWWQP